MLPECLMNGYQRESSMENYKLENAPMLVRRKRYKDSFKASLIQHTKRVVGTMTKARLFKYTENFTTKK